MRSLLQKFEFWDVINEGFTSRVWDTKNQNSIQYLTRKIKKAIKLLLEFHRLEALIIFRYFQFGTENLFHTNCIEID